MPRCVNRATRSRWNGHRSDSIIQGLHLVTMATPNGQKVQIMLEELHDVYGTEWTQTLMYVLFKLTLTSQDHLYTTD